MVEIERRLLQMEKIELTYNELCDFAETIAENAVMIQILEQVLDKYEPGSAEHEEALQQEEEYKCTQDLINEFWSEKNAIQR